MNAVKVKFTTKDLQTSVSVNQWLVRNYGGYSVGQQKNGRLILVVQDEAELSIHAYDGGFTAFAFNGADYGCEPPNSLIRAVALELGITTVRDPNWKRDVEVATTFPSDEYDHLRDVKYKPRKRA